MKFTLNLENKKVHVMNFITLILISIIIEVSLIYQINGMRLIYQDIYIENDTNIAQNKGNVCTSNFQTIVSVPSGLLFFSGEGISLSTFLQSRVSKVGFSLHVSTWNFSFSILQSKSTLNFMSSIFSFSLKLHFGL